MKVNTGEIFLKRSDPWMNDYLPLITLLMKSYLDIKIIPGMDTIDLLALLYYLTNYTYVAVTQVPERRFEFPEG